MKNNKSSSALMPGALFGKLKILSKVENRVRPDGHKELAYLCICECGNHIQVRAYCLANGHTKSCGCLKKIHGRDPIRLYRIWHGMKTRCYNANSNCWSHYGGKGISVCEEWINSFVNFRQWALNNGYSNDLSIDRINNDKGYQPDNCRWATATTQHRNASNCLDIVIHGNHYTLSEVAELLGIKYNVLKSIHRRIGLEYITTTLVPNNGNLLNNLKIKKQGADL